MKHLIIYCHPNPKSFNAAILDIYTKALQGKGHDVRIRDLYQMKFSPVLTAADFEAMHKGAVLPDVKTEQDHIRWAEIITFIYPIWWSGMPALDRGYVDRVLSEGFAYQLGPEGLKTYLNDKKVVLINTMGALESEYEKTGMLKSIRQTTVEGIFEFCGMKVIRHQYFGAVTLVSDSDRKAMLEKVKKLADNISTAL